MLKRGGGYAETATPDEKQNYIYGYIGHLGQVADNLNERWSMFMSPVLK